MVTPSCSVNSILYIYPKRKQSRTSLVVQWLRIPLPVQGIPVQPLVWEHPTCRGTPKSMHHNY